MQEKDARKAKVSLRERLAFIHSVGGKRAGGPEGAAKIEPTFHFIRTPCDFILQWAIFRLFKHTTKCFHWSECRFDISWSRICPILS